MDQDALVHPQLVVVGGNHDNGVAVEAVRVHFPLEAKADHRLICIVSTITKKLVAYMRNAISEKKQRKKAQINKQRERRKANLETESENSKRG